MAKKKIKNTAKENGGKKMNEEFIVLNNGSAEDSDTEVNKDIEFDELIESYQEDIDDDDDMEITEEDSPIVIETNSIFEETLKNLIGDIDDIDDEEEPRHKKKKGKKKNKKDKVDRAEVIEETKEGKEHVQEVKDGEENVEEPKEVESNEDTDEDDYNKKVSENFTMFLKTNKVNKIELVFDRDSEEYNKLFDLCLENCPHLLITKFIKAHPDMTLKEAFDSIFIKEDFKTTLRKYITNELESLLSKLINDFNNLIPLAESEDIQQLNNALDIIKNTIVDDTIIKVISKIYDINISDMFDKLKDNDADEFDRFINILIHAQDVADKVLEYREENDTCVEDIVNRIISLTNDVTEEEIIEVDKNINITDVYERYNAEIKRTNELLHKIFG